MLLRGEGCEDVARPGYPQSAVSVDGPTPTILDQGGEDIDQLS